MGVGSWSRTYTEAMDPEFNPNTGEAPTFPANYGFCAPRVERKMIATEEEMIQAKVPLQNRDYCAHYLITYMRCKRDGVGGRFNPFNACEHEMHDWHECQYEDFVMRMKEYERERRLLQREKAQLEKQRLKDELRAHSAKG